MEKTKGDANLARAVDLLIQNVVPERKEEWNKLKQQYEPQFLFDADNPGRFFMGKIIGDNVVIFSARTLDVIWAFGFTAWRMLEANAAALFQQVPPYTLGTFVKLPDQANMDEAVADIIGNVDYIRCAPYIQSFVWPDGVPRVDEFLARVDDPTKRTKEEQAAYDLTCMGMAFILLHEMQHLILEKDRKKPANPHEEEYACDRFALEYLMKHIDLTSADPRVLSKRAMGIVSAMFVLLALDIPAVWASPGPEHPSAIGRVQAVIRELDIPDYDLAWILLGSLLVGLLRHHKSILPDLFASTPKGLCHQLIERVGTVSK